MKSRPTLYTDDDRTIALPFKFVICCDCEGHGKSSAYLGAFTADEMGGQDDEWREDYFSGRFDRMCEPCDGTGKIAVADESRMTKDQRRQYREQCRADREIDAIQAAERRMGA